MREGKLNVSFIGQNNNFKIDQIENLEPYEFIDKYKPNRHGIIFKEHIFAADLVYSTFCISLLQSDDLAIRNINTNITSTLKFSTKVKTDIMESPKKTKTLKERNDSKAINNDNINSSTNLTSVANLTKIKENIRVIVELYKDDILIYNEEGFNSILIRNIILEGKNFVSANNEGEKTDTVKKVKGKDKDKEKSTIIN